MFINDKYNYTLNGIEHEIILHHNIKIDQKPIHEKILVSNKYMMKYVNDLFDYHSIEYCVTKHTLLGVYIFHGINLFHPMLEICLSSNYYHKIQKIQEEIQKDGFNIEFTEQYIVLSTIFFDKIKTSVYLYLLDDSFVYHTFDKKTITHSFYDIYPIKKTNFEEFQISVPNKIEKVLESCDFQLEYICFTKNKKDKKTMIEEVEIRPTIQSIVRENISSFISVIKPFLFV